MHSKLISVIIPVYNTSEYLPRCLDSVRNNTHQELEVLCINDGSRDNSLEVLNAYAAQDSRIRVIDQKNAGVSAARNRGLDEAAGEYIAFVDSDDWIHRQYFEILLDGLWKHNADVAVCVEQETCKYLEGSNQEDSVEFRELNLEQIVSHHSAKRRIWGRIYRKTIIGSKRFSLDMKLAEDTVFNLDVICSRSEAKIVLCDTPLYYYFTRQDSAVHTMHSSMLKPVAEWYISHADSMSEQICGIYTEEALKALYSWRYGTFVNGKKDELIQLRPMLRKAMGLLYHSKGLPFHKKLVYTVFSAIPLSYRLFRIHADPTLLTWEKNMRQQQKI